MSTAHLSLQPQHDDLSTRLRQELVASMRHTGVHHSHALEQAFLTIPREAFVSCFYEQDESSRTIAWKLVTASQMGREDYLTEVYRDQSLIIKIDERHWPISSSSQPSAMAKMLEALDVRPGHRVLEIGTGSGYNAALLSTITGNPGHIVTIEQDEVLATAAMHALEQVVGPGVTGIVGDGFVGWKQGALYDRIIATASVTTLPVAWIEQLQVGGKLVMDLQGTLASGFLVVEKTIEGITGHFLAEPLHFMPLESGAITAQKVSIANLLHQPCQVNFTLKPEDVFPNRLFDPAFRWFLQWRIPGCQISKQKQVQRDTGAEIHSIFVIEPENKAMMRLRRKKEEETWNGEVYGPLSVWQDIQQAYEDFRALGEPGQEQYHLVMEQAKPILIIGSVRLPLG